MALKMSNNRMMLLILFLRTVGVFAFMHLSLNPLVIFGRVLHGDQQLFSVFFVCCTSIATVTLPVTII